MFEELLSFRPYLYYLYIPAGIGVLCALVYLAVNALGTLKIARKELGGVGDIKVKLERTTGSVSQIKKSVDYNKSLFVGTLGGIGVLATLRRILKRKKKMHTGLVKAAVAEFDAGALKKEHGKLLVSAAKSIGPVVNSVRKMM